MMMMMMMMIRLMIFTDGFALGNPSPTGYGVVINLPKLSLFAAQAMKKK